MKGGCVHHWVVTPAWEARDPRRTPARCRRCGARATFASLLAEPSYWREAEYLAATYDAEIDRRRREAC